MVLTLLHSAILWLSNKKVYFMHQSKHGQTKLFHFSGVCFTSPWVFFSAASLLLKPAPSPGCGFNLWINYGSSSSEPTRELGGWHRQNERVPSSGLLYSLFYELWSCRGCIRPREIHAEQNFAWYFAFCGRTTTYVLNVLLHKNCIRCLSTDMHNATAQAYILVSNMPPTL